MLNNLRTFTFKTTAVSGTSCAFRDELIGCQHSTEDYGSSVHMDSDYAFDASVDDSISSNTRQILKELLENFSDTEMFTFAP
jgi:hypothetical protein